MEIADLVYRDWAKELDFIEVVDVNLGGGYQWDEFHGWYSPSRRRYFWSGDGGCSCNAWGDNLYKLDDLENGSKDDMERAMRSYLDGVYNVSASDVLDAVRQVKTFRPVEQ